MEKNLPHPMTPLDRMTTTKELQIMKLMLPYLPSAYRGMFAIFAKFSELQAAIRLFRRHGNDFQKEEPIKSKEFASPAEILEDLRPFMDSEESETIDTILNAMDMMEVMKDMDFSDFSNMNPMANSDELSGMMDMFNNIMKGNGENE